jgi:hypothetical protein
MEHWEKTDLDLWADGHRTVPLPDAVVLGHQEYRRPDVERLIAENPDLRFFDYFTVWTYPDTTWINQGNTFFDYLYALLSQHGLLWIDPKTGFPGLATFKNRVLVRLSDSVKASAPDVLAQEIILASRGQGFYLDQYYPDGLDDWMAVSAGGAFDVQRLYPDQVECHCRTMKALANELSASSQLLTGGTSLHAAPGYGIAARYFEGTGTFVAHPWDTVLPLWKENSSNVLSVLAEDAPQVDRALQEWGAWGGWLAFTTQTEGAQGEAVVSQAYGRARALQSVLRPS